jgi:hypothetical protein
MLGGIIGDLTGLNKHARLKGSVVLMRKNVLDLNDFGATVIDGIGEFLGKGVTCQLISSTVVDPSEHPYIACPIPLLALDRSVCSFTFFVRKFSPSNTKLIISTTRTVWVGGHGLWLSLGARSVVFETGQHGKTSAEKGTASASFLSRCSRAPDACDKVKRTK